MFNSLKKNSKEKEKSFFNEKLNKWMKTAPNYVTGYDVVADNDNAYIKIYFKEAIFHTEVSFISNSLIDLFEKSSLKFKGINVYNNNNEVCFTFIKCRGM